MREQEIHFLQEDRPDEAVCQVCGERRPELELVVCRQCGTLHHRDCWEYLGHCAIFGCLSHASVEPSPASSMVVLSMRLPPGSNRPPPRTPGSDSGRSATPAASGAGGPSLPSRFLPPSDQPLAHYQRVVSLSAPRVRLDLDVPLEQRIKLYTLVAAVATALVLVSLVLEYGMLGQPALLALAIGGALTYAGACLWSTTDCTYFLDNELRLLEYSESFLGSTFTRVACRFDQVEQVTVSGTRHGENGRTWWGYATAIVQTNGAVTVVSDSFREDLARASRLGEALAEHLDVPFIPGLPGHTLEVAWTHGRYRARHVPAAKRR